MRRSSRAATTATPLGKSVTFRVVSGHRDALSTDCPGALIYADLDAIGAAAQATGSPKIVDASATPPGLGADAAGALVPIAFRARVLGGAAWTVTVVDAHGAPVASGSGSGETLAWVWNGQRSDGTPLAASTPLSYRIEAHDATGVSALPLVASLGAEPTTVQAPPFSLSTTVISPDGDGVDDGTVIDYTLPGPSTVTIEIAAPDGTIAATLVSALALPAGGQSARWGGEGPAGIVADGIYTVRLSVTDALGQVAERSETVSVIRAVRKLKLSRTDVGRNGAVTASWQQTQQATLSGDLSTGSRAPSALIAAVIEPGPQTFRLTSGQLAAMPDGTYAFVLRARTAVGEQVLRASFRLDRGRPRRASSGCACTVAGHSSSSACPRPRPCACSRAPAWWSRASCAARVSTASASVCRRASPRACACSWSIPRATRRMPACRSPVPPR